MSPLLKLKKHNEKKENLFELKYLLSLTTKQRFEMMSKKTREMMSLLEKSGHRKSSEIVKRDKIDDLIIMKRAAGRSKDREDLKFLQNIKKLKTKKRRKADG